MDRNSLWELIQISEGIRNILLILRDLLLALKSLVRSVGVVTGSKMAVCILSVE